MELSSSNKVKLPTLVFKIGHEPINGAVVNQYANVEYIERVKGILSDTEYRRVKASFMGPVLKASERRITMSGKIVHSLLCRSLTTLKEKELWMHFGGQPMRFSIREFHMVTGLKCTNWERDEETEYKQQEWAKGEENHTVEDVLDLLQNTEPVEEDERFCLSLLILIESILLSTYKGQKFPVKYLQQAQDVRLMLNHPWGKEAFEVLFKSIKKVVRSNLEKLKFDIHGYPLAFHLWILESVPLLQSAYSTLSLMERQPAFLCEKYIHTSSPTMQQVQGIEAKNNLKVICILPPIADDPEDGVHLEDVEDAELAKFVDLVNKGYKMTREDWDKGFLYIDEVLEKISKASYLFCHNDTAGGASTNQEETIMSKLETLINIVQARFSQVNSRLSKIEENSNPFYSYCRRTQKNTGGIPPPGSPPTENPENSPEQQFFTMPTQMSTETVQLTENVTATETVQLTENVTATQTVHSDVGSLGNQTQDIHLDDQPEETDHHGETDHQGGRNADKEENDDGVKYMDGVTKTQDLHHEDLTEEGTTLGEAEGVTQSQEIPHDHLTQEPTGQNLQHQTQEEDTEEVNTTPTFTPEEEKKKKRCKKVQIGGEKKKRKVDDEKKELQHQRRSQRLTKPSKPTITPYKAEINPATVSVLPKFDPFLSPNFNCIEELNAWKKSKRRSGVFTDRDPLTPPWFDKLERTETEMLNTHINAALGAMMLRRNSDPTYCQNRRLPKATFVSVDFLRTLIYCTSSFRKDRLKSNYAFPGNILDVVRGKHPSICPPAKKWRDVDVVYGVAYDGDTQQYIGVCIEFKTSTITAFECRSEETRGDLIKTVVQPLAALIPFLLLNGIENPVKPPDNVSTYKVLIPKKFIKRTNYNSNCALFIIKMIECHSLQLIELMNKVTDSSAEDIKARIALDIYKEFVVNKVELVEELPQATKNKQITINLERVLRDCPFMQSFGPVNENIYHCEGFLEGPKDTPYEGGLFKMTVNFPPNFPNKAPKVCFNTEIYHPNISPKGAISLKLLRDPSLWYPNLTVSHVFNAIVNMLKEPEIGKLDCYFEDIAEVYRNDKKRFLETARNMTYEHAMG